MVRFVDYFIVAFWVRDVVNNAETIDAVSPFPGHLSKQKSRENVPLKEMPDGNSS
jgi:hypothetical protein